MDFPLGRMSVSRQVGIRCPGAGARAGGNRRSSDAPPISTSVTASPSRNGVTQAPRNSVISPSTGAASARCYKSPRIAVLLLAGNANFAIGNPTSRIWSGIMTFASFQLFDVSRILP